MGWFAGCGFRVAGLPCCKVFVDNVERCGGCRLVRRGCGVNEETCLELDMIFVKVDIAVLLALKISSSSFWRS